MSLVKRNKLPWGFSPMFSDFFGADDLTFDNAFNRDWVPAVNVAESDKQFEIEFAVPGMKKEDFKINIENNVLTVSAQRKEEKEEKKKNYTRQEYSYNSFLILGLLSPDELAAKHAKHAGNLRERFAGLVA